VHGPETNGYFRYHIENPFVVEVANLKKLEVLKSHGKEWRLV
jgi:hypothetical protein